MMDDQSVVAIFDSHEKAQEAIDVLRKAGTEVTKLSIVGRDYHTEEQVTGYYNTGDRMKYWGKFGAFWGGLWGLLIGAAVFVIPGIGPVVVAGPFVVAIASALESAVVFGGLSALGAGLVGLGIPRDSVLRYETAIRADQFLLILHGSAEEVAKAHDALRTTRATAVEMHESESPISVGSAAGASLPAAGGDRS